MFKNHLNIFRRLSQGVFFVLFVGLFSQAFSGFKSLFMFLFEGHGSLATLGPLVVIAALDLLVGRFFCGWLCAFGSFNDFLYAAGRKLFGIRFKMPRWLDSILKYVKYLVLGYIVIGIWAMNNSALTGYNPWDAFGDPSLQAIFAAPSAYLALLIVSLGAMLVERFFCRYLCPLGAIQAILSQFRLVEINKPTGECGKCQLCSNACSMGLQLSKMEKVTSGECIGCLKCVAVCPRKNPRTSIFEVCFNGAAYAVSALVAFVVLYSSSHVLDVYGSPIDQASGQKSALSGEENNYGASAPNPTTTDQGAYNQGGSGSSDHGNSSLSSSPSSSLSTQYKDGVYTGSARGHRPGLTVSVTIKNDTITNIQIIANNETRSYANAAFAVVPQEIVAQQTTHVDSVSGATHTSQGLMMAVANALSKAAQ